MENSYQVICDEIGNPKWNPFSETSSKESAEKICQEVSKKYKARVFIEVSGKRIYMVDYSGYNKFKH